MSGQSVSRVLIRNARFMFGNRFETNIRPVSFAIAIQFLHTDVSRGGNGSACGVSIDIIFQWSIPVS